MSEKKKDERTRNWVFIEYPESAPDDWRDKLDDLLIEWIESPLHDRDVNPDGTPKKHHWHVLLLFAGKKSFDQVYEITKSVNGTIPKPCISVRGQVRYMAHLDNPEKAQYSQSDIIGHQGADIQSYLKPTSAMRYQCIKDMQRYIVENNVNEYWKFLNYAAENRFDDWFPLLCDNCSYVISNFIKSRRHGGNTPEVRKLVDPETGEMFYAEIVMNGERDEKTEVSEPTETDS